jgi:hypothetical protein
MAIAEQRLLIEHPTCASEERCGQHGGATSRHHVQGFPGGMLVSSDTEQDAELRSGH